MRFPKEANLWSWRKTWQFHVHYLVHASLQQMCNKCNEQGTLVLLGLPVVIPSHATFGVNVHHSGNYCLITVHWQAASLNNNNPCSHPPSSHAAPSLHVFTPFQVIFLLLLVRRPSAHDGRSSPFPPNPVCSKRLPPASGAAPIVNHR